MKRNDLNFKEQFIILHDEDGELVVKKSEIDVLQSYDNSTYVHLKGGTSFYVHELIDEILELL